MVATPLNILFLVLNAGNILSHAFMLYLLLNIERKSVQQIYLLNLSFSQITRNAVLILLRMPSTVSSSYNAQHIFDGNFIYLRIIYDYGIMTSYYLTMLYIAMDMYFDISLGKRYTQFWKMKKAKFLASGTWLIAIILTVMISALCHVTVDYVAVHYFIYFNQSISPFVTYTNPGVDIAFIALAIPTCVRILPKYIRSVKASHARIPVWEMFYKSSHCVPILVCCFFMLFTALPDLVFTYYKYTSKEIPFIIDVVCCTTYLITDLSHSITYICIKKPDKEVLSKSLHANLAFVQRFKSLHKGWSKETVHLPFIVGGPNMADDDIKNNTRHKVHLSDMYIVEFSTKREHKEESDVRTNLLHSQEEVNFAPEHSNTQQESKEIRNTPREEREEKPIPNTEHLESKRTRKARRDLPNKSSDETANDKKRTRGNCDRNKKRRYGESHEVEKDKSMRKIGTYDMFAYGRSTGTGTVLTSII